jgi:Lecithin retinol acyltransferase
VARSEHSALHLQEPPPGSHLVTPRRGYLHHGIYVGDGKVVHYAGLACGLHRGPVEEVPLDRFAHGRPVWVKSHAASNFECQDVIERARSRVGENCYQLLTNNCEHFCEWCLRGEPRSYQVEALLARLRVLHATVRFVTQSVLALGRVGLRQRRVATDA